MNKYSKLVKAVLFGVVTLGLLGLLLSPSFRRLGVEQKTSANENGRAEYLARVKEGMSLLSFAKSSAEVSNSISSMNVFMMERSGMEINSSVNQRLLILENSALSDSSKLISFDKLVDTLTDLALERNAELTDQELDEVVTRAQGFTTTELAATNKSSLIALRPGNYVDMTKEEAIKELKALKSPKMQLVAKDYIRNFISQEVKTTLINLASASPEKFGENWDLLNNRPSKGLTPSQSYLIAYSLISGDLLADGKLELENRMQKVYEVQVKLKGKYVSPNGYVPYGDNGYLYSSPVKVFFNENVQLKLLQKLEG